VNEVQAAPVVAPERDMNTRMAAEYLGLKLPLMRYYLYSASHDGQPLLKSDYRLGNALMFTRGTLDAFKASYLGNPDRDYDKAEAAEYMGVGMSVVHYHMYGTKLLQPDRMRRNQWVFSKGTLDDFRKKIDAGLVLVKGQEIERLTVENTAGDTAGNTTGGTAENAVIDPHADLVAAPDDESLEEMFGEEDELRYVPVEDEVVMPLGD